MTPWGATMSKRKPKLRMFGYYIGFVPTGVEAVDRILSAVACAAKSAHHTEDWCEEYWPDGEGRDGHTGKSCEEMIQNAANAAAEAFQARSGG